uniref:HSac2 domain-containing protein n=1 Tax=Oreochromis aureus TaxID=47969 RepID=A0A668RLJ0_OREAU
MADAEDEVVKGSEEQQQQVEEEVDLSSSPTPPEDSQPAAGRKGDAQERPAESVTTSTQGRRLLVEPTLDQFKLRKYFVLRPGTLNQAIKDVEALVNEEVDGSVLSVWLMAEVDHWNNEKERIVLITELSLLVFKYDFMMFNCDQMQRIPLNFVDRISHGTFSFPKRSLLEWKSFVNS